MCIQPICNTQQYSPSLEGSNGGKHGIWIRIWVVWWLESNLAHFFMLLKSFQNAICSLLWPIVLLGVGVAPTVGILHQNRARYILIIISNWCTLVIILNHPKLNLNNQQSCSVENIWFPSSVWTLLMQPPADGNIPPLMQVTVPYWSTNTWQSPYSPNYL